ncbi:hypothetical protein, partial [Salmonella enterica]|uniref:hypothetical protein n=1 Tax=Salmonella enterica TaxID=28901 RepID=UPI003D2C6BFE
GVTVTRYVATAKTRAECLAAEYGSGFATTTINNPSAVGDLVTSTFNIASLDGKWLKFRIVLSSASQGYTPSLHSIEITYQASQASYFFTKMF